MPLLEIALFLSNFGQLDWERDDQSSGLVCLAVPVVVILLIIFLTRHTLAFQKSTQQALTQQAMEEAQATASVPVGRYLIGLPSANEPIDGVLCAVSSGYFHFLAPNGGRLGYISRNAIDRISVVDKSQLDSQVIAQIAVFGLAGALVSGKVSEFCLVIEWDDERIMRQKTVFEFSGTNANTNANTAANTLRLNVFAKVEILRPTEKKCPYCAETIKKDAVICRYCNRELGLKLG